MDFEWDPKKAGDNLRKHGVSFDEAASVFGDPLAITYADPEHSSLEERLITFGRSLEDRLLVVAHTTRSPRIRIFSARRMTRHERNFYEED